MVKKKKKNANISLQSNNNSALWFLTLHPIRSISQKIQLLFFIPEQRVIKGLLSRGTGRGVGRKETLDEIKGQGMGRNGRGVNDSSSDVDLSFEWF